MGGKGGPLAFLNKKGWHPGSIQNQEKVWKREEEHTKELKKAEELRKQIAEEREKEEMRAVAEAAGVVQQSDRLDWMYQGGMVARQEADKRAEEALLGSREAQLQDETAVGRVDKVAALPSFYAEDTPASANEVWSRLHSDPLFAIRQQEQAQRKAIMANPVQVDSIKKQVAAAQAAKMSAKATKKAEKQAKKQAKKEKKRLKRALETAKVGLTAVRDNSPDSSDAESDPAPKRRRVSPDAVANGHLAKGHAHMNGRGSGDARRNGYPAGRRGDADDRLAPARWGEVTRHSGGRHGEEHGRYRDEGGEVQRERAVPRDNGWDDRHRGVPDGDRERRHANGGHGGRDRDRDGDRSRDQALDGPSRAESHPSRYDERDRSGRTGGGRREHEERDGRRERRDGDRRHRDDSRDVRDPSRNARQGSPGRDGAHGSPPRRTKDTDADARRGGEKEGRGDGGAKPRSTEDAARPRAHVIDGASAQGADLAYGLNFGGNAPEEVHTYDRSSVADATRKRLEEAARQKEKEEREKAAQRHQRKEYRPGQMTEEERQRRLAEMTGNAAVHEDQRHSRLKHAADKDAREEAHDRPAAGGGPKHHSDTASFLAKATKDVYGAGGAAAALEDRVNRRKFFAERGGEAAFRR